MSSNQRRLTGWIPRGAIAGAAVAFVLVLSLILWRMSKETHPPHLVFQILFGSFIGSLPASFILLGGYVHRDARRRGMRPTPWLLLVLFIPNFVGFVLYFLMRHPLPVCCPQCGAAVRRGASYCPQCGFQVMPGCPNCRRAISPGDAYCSYCGQALAVPAG